MSAPRPANATSISDAAREHLRGARDALASEFGVTVVPARVWGARWAAIPGLAPEELPLAPPERVSLGGGFGLILYGLNELSRARATACCARAAEYRLHAAGDSPAG